MGLYNSEMRQVAISMLIYSLFTLKILRGYFTICKDCKT